MRIFLLSILFILLFSTSKGQVVNIPDANFKTALPNHVPVINTNADGEIQVSEICLPGSCFLKSLPNKARQFRK